VTKKPVQRVYSLHVVCCWHWTI